MEDGSWAKLGGCVIDLKDKMQINRKTNLSVLWEHSNLIFVGDLGFSYFESFILQLQFPFSAVLSECTA